MFIDTHAHLNFSAYKNDFNKVIKNSLKGDIWMINIGTNYQTSKRAVELTKNYKERIFASVGLHPINLDTGLLKIRRDKNEIDEDFYFENDFNTNKYGELIKEGGDRVVAVGEIGFDYWYRPKSKTKREQFKEKQKELFRKEVTLAEEFKLPLILHCRLGYEDLINELKKINYRFGGVVHCFCGSWEQAKTFLEIGYYIGINGIIFKLELDEIIKKTPLDRILVETDCPYLPPPEIVLREPDDNLEQGRIVGKERNEPVNVKYMAEKIAKIKNIKIEKVAKITTENAKKLFKLY
jgi:TatD DNase family protein